MVDFLKKIRNSDKFRSASLTFISTGLYCSYPPGSTEYFQFWDEEKRRCLDGYTADDGDYITGYNYFYLNYCPIDRIVYEEVTDRFGVTKQVRRKKLFFPDFYDYDYYFYLAVLDAEDEGKHMCVLKSRRKGYSFKCGSMCCRNYYFIPNSKSYVYVSNKQYLTEDGILNKAWAYLDFIDKNTAWGKKRQVFDQMMHKRASFLVSDEFGNKVETGYKSEIIGVSLKDNPGSVRGKAGKLILFEEAGSFTELAAAWQVARPSVEQDGIAYGLMLAFGCVCAGTRIWTADGNCVNVEDLKQEDGIVGWDTYQAVPQNISNMNPPAEKECVRITTASGRTLECSKDHPLLWSTPGKTRRVPGKRAENAYMKSWLWHEAGLCKVGEQVGIIDEIPIFGKKQMWEPRLVGWLIGDGSYGHDKTPRLFNCDDSINTYIYDNFDCVTERQYLTKDGKTYKETRIKGICPKLRELGIYGQTKSAKRLPNNIHTYDYKSLTELIGGLYDTDGYIRICNDKRVRIILTQSHREILDQVQEVLLHFGVHSTVRKINTKPRTHTSNGRTIVDKDGEWRLEINDITSVAKFAEHITLSVGYKLAALDCVWTFTLTHLAKHRNYVCGVHIDRIVKIEDIGLRPIYNLTAKEQHNYIANGIVTHNTGGDEGSAFTSLKDMFYNPKGYNCLEFENIWDEAVEPGSKCGFFIPQFTNLDVRDNDSKRLYMDEDGNTLHKKAMDYVLSLRREVIENATSQQAVDRYVAEQPITPREACLEFTGNIFPKKELQNHLAFIRTHKNLQAHKLVGDLTFDHDGNIHWEIKKHGDITKYPLGKNDDPTGAIVIWEHPVKDAPHGLYIAGIDSYDYDQSGTNSLGSCIIYKRFLNFEEYYDLPVAEYTGRPATAEIFYENVRKLLLYYNATAMYENQNKGLFTYMTQKHCDYLLADQPDILADIVGNSTVLRKKGCHMNKQIKAWGEGKIKDWLNEEYAPGKKNLTKILSEPLLEELISYNDLGNFDRCVTKGTLITTSRGDIPVEDVFVGDKVLTHTGQYKDVTWTDAHIHTGNIVTLKAVGDYQTLRCTDNHPIYTAYTTKKKHKYRKDSLQMKEFLRADQLTNKYLFTLLPTRKNLENINLSQGMLYVLGWIMADGYCASNGYTVRITFQKGQDFCAEQCKLHIEEYLSDEEWYYTQRGRRFKRKPTRIEDHGTYLRLTVASKKLHALALRFGCKPNDKKIADDIYNKYGNLMPFVLGWLEGDGHQRYNIGYDGYSRNGIELATIYEDLARQCRQIMLDNGIYSSIREIKPRNGKRQVSILISNEYVRHVLNKYSEDYGLISYKFKPTAVHKNTSKVLHDSEGFWVPIKVVDTQAVSEQVYNFEVADDHTYIANAITTHNCMAFMQIIIYREQLFNVVVKLREDVNKSRLLFDGPIFTNEWFNDSSCDTNDNIPVFTF